MQAVKGAAQYRESPADQWKPVQPGVEVTQGAEFRTGLGQRIDILIEPDHLLTVKRLGAVSLLQAIEEDGVIKTNVGMKYGRTEYKVEEGSAQHESTISAPGATLAIRSTDTEVRSDPLFGTSVAVYNSPGSIVRNLKGNTVVMTNGEVDENDRSAAGAAIRERTLVMANRYGQTTDDQQNLERLPGFGGVDSDRAVTFREVLVQQQREMMLNTDFDASNFSVGTINPNLTFRIFDLGSPDGDAVRVLFNGQVLNSNLTLTEIGTPFNVFLSQRDNALTLEPAGFGSSGGVSAGVEVPDGGATFDFVFEQGGETSKSLDIVFTGSTEFSSN